MIYADPGSGILIWQLLLALFFGATFFFSRLRHWVVAKLRPNHQDDTLNSAEKSRPRKVNFKTE